MKRSTLKYPIQLVDGKLALTSGSLVDRDAIISVIETRLQERVMRPLSYGTPDYLFESVATASLIPARLELALKNQIPVVKFQVSGKVDEAGVQTLSIYWWDNNNELDIINLELS